MKASEILNLYSKVAPVIGNRASAWIIMLRLCANADKGLTCQQLAPLTGSSEQGIQTAVRRWKKAGLITAENIRARGNTGGRHRKTYKATAKLHALCRLEPEAAQ